jgi:hypothetical protein
MADGKCCDDFENAQQAGAYVGWAGPTRVNRDEGCREKQGEKEQEMADAFGDVAHAEREQAGETAFALPCMDSCPPVGGLGVCEAADLDVIQLVERLPRVAILADDANVGIGGDQRVDEVDRV